MEYTCELYQKELHAFCDPIQINAAASDEDFETAFRAAAEAAQLDVSIVHTKIYTGGFFNTKFYGGLLLAHPEFDQNYFRFCVHCDALGNTAVYGERTEISVYTYGMSKLMGKEAYLQNTRVFDGKASSGVLTGALFGGAVGAGFAVGSAASGIIRGSAKALKKGFTALTLDQDALRREREWYEMVEFVLARTVSILSGEE